MKKVGLIVRKELLDAVRDTHTFLLVVVTPLVLYPVLFVAMGYFMQTEKTKEEKAIYKVGIINPAFDLPLFTLIKKSGKFEVLTGNEAVLMFEKEKVKAVLEIMDGEAEEKIVIHYDGADKESQNAMKTISKIVSEYNESLVKNRISEYGLSTKILEPIVIEKKNIAPAKRMGGFMLGTLIPYLLIIISFSGAMHTALDITAGEKERKTIETLLVTNVKREEIVMGKMLSIFSISILTTASGLVGLVATLYSGFSFLTVGETFSLSIPWFSCILMLIVMLPLLWFFSSLLMTIGSASRTMKEAGTYSSYLSFFVIILAVFSVLRLTFPGWSLFFIPVLSTAVLQQQILIGEFSRLNSIITIVSSIIYALIVFSIAKTCFEKEEILFRS
ncbi:MAG: ABC transporter permease subunit [candidate division WOR-3 bacterium]|nr:ABC transporter permease subunit [candidate division WOR-3 bacterium]